MLKFNGFTDEQKLFKSLFLTNASLKMEFEEDDLFGRLYTAALNCLNEEYEIKESKTISDTLKFTVTLYIAPPLESNIFHLKVMLDYQKELFMEKYNKIIERYKREIGEGMSQYVSYHKDESSDLLEPGEGEDDFRCCER